jgi:DNA-binding NarL/FixJ family response regulator
MLQVSSEALRKRSIPILVADDSEVVRKAIRQLLSADNAIAIVGEAANFAQTIQMASDLKPRVIVVDLHMPDEKVVTPQEVKSRLSHDFHVLAISVWNDEASKELAESLGAAAFLDKMNLAGTLIPAIMQWAAKRGAAT